MKRIKKIITYPEKRPAEPKIIGERYCERCRRMHPIFSPDFDLIEHTIQNAAVDIMEDIDNEILEELLRKPE